MISSAPTRLGKYTLVARLAKGGMAEIFLARQQSVVGISRMVVVKRILPHLAEESQFVRMFLEEARLAALVNHPNVVQIFDVDQFEGSYYIAMEYINGLSLSTVVRELRRRERVIPFSIAAEIVCQTCAGLHAAHELKDESGNPLQLVHRDVSPHNLMITEGGVVKLVDFGIAKAQDSTIQTRTGNIKGKYPYLSPEQCRGEPLDRRTDIFSLGVVFFEMVVGRRLFQRSTELMTLKAITEEPIPNVRDLRPEVPVEIGGLIQRCLERQREQRFTTTAELAETTRGILASLKLQTSPSEVAHFLESEFSELMQERTASIKKAASLTGVRIPVVEGFSDGRSEESADSSTALPLKPHPIQPRKARGGLTPRRVLVASLIILFLAISSGLAYRLLRQTSRPAGPPLFFGMAPSFPAEVVQREMASLLSYLERRLHRRIELVVEKDYHSLRQGLVEGKLAFAHLPPLQFVLARNQDRKIKILVSHLYEGTRAYQALIIARNNSGIKSLAEIKGHPFCYVDPESTSGYLLARYYLRQQGLDPDHLFSKITFSGDHIAVMKDILSGTCDAGAVYSGAMIAAPNLGVASSRLWHLAVTGQLPHEVIGASSKLPDEIAQEMRRALLEMQPERDLGSKLVGPTLRISGFAEARENEFELAERVARAEGMIK